jgi:hypothetical protein
MAAPWLSVLLLLLVSFLAGASAQEEDGKPKGRYEVFLEKNAQREGVTTTLSGLQYNVLKSGDGPQPGPNTPCAVHYRGTLITGQSFGELAVGLCDRSFASTACHGNTVLTAINCRSL